MKTRFSSLDIARIVTELQRLVGMRVMQIYDVDHKTYLIKLQRNEEKSVLLFESGIRIHTTAFEWPKNICPSGFSMKLRKHLKNKRLESLQQLGADRIIDLQFGSGEVAHHVILELFDRGNILLTDYTMTIINVLRPHTEGDKFKFAVREKYPVDRAKEKTGLPSEEKLVDIFSSVKHGDSVRKVLILHLDYGPALIDHVMIEGGFPKNSKFAKDLKQEDLPKLASALMEAERIMNSVCEHPLKGVVIHKMLKRETQDDLRTNLEFHPFLFKQHIAEPYSEYENFDKAVDEFFSSIESQKSDLKALHLEREAISKVDKIRVDQEERVKELTAKQERDRMYAELITHNVEKVDAAILAVRSALAAQMSWDAIADLVAEATRKNDPIASLIQKLKLETNHITLLLSDPYDDSEEDPPDLLVDIDLDLSAHANAKHYYDGRKSAAFKQQKTMESQGKVLKSAQKKVLKVLKEVQAMTTISKARKSYWFEKFFWFISSENYLVIGGRDTQQNEIIVKRYLRPGDVYVHADIQGASSIVIKNPKGKLIPPKTLNEAGTMAVCYSVGWEAKVVCSAWWVHYDQVSKTAPTGEYLTSGSFMIRGQKNYLLPAQLSMGFSIIFRLEESSVDRHKDERCIRITDEIDQYVSEQNEEMEEIPVAEIEDKKESNENSDEESNENSDNCEFPDTSVTLRKQLENLSISRETTTEVQYEGLQDSVIMNNEESEKNELEQNNTKEEYCETSKGEDDKWENVVVENKSKLFSSDESDTDSDIVPLVKRKRLFVEYSSESESEEISKSTSDWTCVTSGDVLCKSVRFATELAVALGPQRSEIQGLDDRPPLKRGQRSKLKKIKEKYKDQDEEEKQLRMSILQSAGTKKDSRKGKKGEKIERAIPKINTKIKVSKGQVNKKVENNLEDEEDETERIVANDVDMINFLTGQPLPEDELLYAIPVVAPYNAVLNYKYKVKLTPGNGKRGKAARAAVELFTRSKDCSQRDKDLIRNVHDQLLARNLPGKVKLSAPQFKKLKK